MGSQFVDINADGSLDILVATFDGSPHVAHGSPMGFREPVHLFDSKGERILISSQWNYEGEYHEDLDRALPEGDETRARCTSAAAFDWDGDGDFDLLLGAYETGRLYLQLNEGTNAKPRFTGKNVFVMSGGKPLETPDKLTTIKLVDWDSDGDMDIVAGTYEGHIVLSLNEGKPGKPAFGAYSKLLSGVPGSGAQPAGPSRGLYPEVVDLDGDGDLDLVVGGLTKIEPQTRKLSEAEIARVEELERKQDEANKKMRALFEKIDKLIAERVAAEKPADDAERRAIEKEVREAHEDEIDAVWGPLRKLGDEIDELKPRPAEKSFVWFYERL